MPFILIDRTAGTNIGDMTGDGGLAAAFDGDTTQDETACAGGPSGNDCYIGKTLASAKRFGKAVIYGSNDQGFMRLTNPSITINIRGKQGAVPIGRADGTVIGTATFTDTSDESAGRTITSTDGVTFWDHIWAEVIQNSGNNQHLVAELELYEFIPAGGQVVFIA